MAEHSKHLGIRAFTYTYHCLFTSLLLFFTLTSSEKLVPTFSKPNKYPKLRSKNVLQNHKFSNEVNVFKNFKLLYNFPKMFISTPIKNSKSSIIFGK